MKRGNCKWRTWLAGMVCMLAVRGVCAGQPVEVENGLLDLRGWDWNANPKLELRGEWALYWGQLLGLDALGRGVKSEKRVPEAWSQGGADGGGTEKYGHGTYHVKILLGKARPELLALEVSEYMTAFELELNGKAAGGNGQVGVDRATSVPAFQNRYFMLPQDSDVVDVVLRGSNHHHHKGGLVEAPQLGDFYALYDGRKERMILGGILIGLMLMAGVYQFMLYIHRKKDLATLMCALWGLVAAVHFACINERWPYGLLGEEYWALLFRLEMLTIFAMICIGFMFFWYFFEGSYNRRAYQIGLGFMVAQALFVLLAPIQLALMMDLLIPIDSLLTLLYFGGQIYVALRRKADGARALALATAVWAVAVFWNNFPMDRHIGHLVPLHYFMSAYILTVSWIVSTRIARIHSKVAALSRELEQANAEIAEQNKWLEREVELRTAELVTAQNAAHKLELESKKRDLEALSANNQMKIQVTRNLVEELDKLLHSEGEYQSALRKLIGGLKGQIALEERVQVLHNDLQAVNAEFFERLQGRFPQLSKTEREICAYFKLNMSSKDIASLRKTSLNTINVARHRIRKKLGLERDEELEGFIQQF